jgi:actin-related protein 2
MVSGGTSMFPGFPTRIENDMNRFYKEQILKGKEPSENAKVKIQIIVIL